MRILFVAVLLTACSGDFEDDTLSASEDELTASSQFNHDGVSHHAQKVGLKHQNAPLRDIDGKPIGKTVSGSTIRMEGLEAVSSSIGTLYYTWGDGQPSGHILASDLSSAPGIDVGSRAGNGEKCNTTTKSYWVRPQHIEGDLRYIGPHTGDSYSFKWYGTPGDPIDDYTYVSWSWIDKVGGGIVRALVHKDDVFYPCTVKSITSHSVATPGWVKVVYGMVQSNGHHYYGWLVHSHQYNGGATVMHVALRSL